MPDAQTGMLPDIGGFLEQGHFEKHIIYNTWKKDHVGKKFWSFSTESLKPASQMTRGWNKPGHFFPQSRHFYSIFI